MTQDFNDNTQVIGTTIALFEAVSGIWLLFGLVLLLVVVALCVKERAVL